MNFFRYWKNISIAVIFAANAASPAFCAMKTDVLIIGGGASGTAAAIQAARMGAKTILAEETDWLGGKLTSAGVSAIDGDHQLPSGIWGEFRDELREHYGGPEPLDSGWVSHTLFEPSAGNAILKKMIGREKNASVMYGTAFISARHNGKGWEATVRRGGKTETISAKILVDATELGDAAKACGVKYDIGMEARSITGESIAPEKANGIIQDITFVATLKDYGKDADRTIARPAGYDPEMFYCSCNSPKCVSPREPKRIGKCEDLITYGKLPNDKYMINWPVNGNDYYVNLIELSPAEREKKLQEARLTTLRFVYYLQTEMGMKNLGLADDEFPTPDRLALIPYHRESRRIHGLVRFTLDDIAHPYDRPDSLYRTGVAVGDYPVDHHHARYPGPDELPDLHFYPIPSYSLPMGVMFPQGHDNIIVAEKSISVSNLANGTTRLQPVVIQIGQAAGAAAALAVKGQKNSSEVGVRELQNALLEAKGYIMPYLDVPQEDPFFLPLQRIGATGILKGSGKSVNWANETWFRAEDPVMGYELEGMKEAYPDAKVKLPQGELTVQEAAELVAAFAKAGKIALPGEAAVLAKGLLARAGEENIDMRRQASRKETALLIDGMLDPFNRLPVDIRGRFIR